MRRRCFIPVGQLKHLVPLLCGFEGVEFARRQPLCKRQASHAHATLAVVATPGGFGPTSPFSQYFHVAYAEGFVCMGSRKVQSVSPFRPNVV